MSIGWARRAAGATATVIAVVLLGAPGASAQAPQDLIVQSTTSVRDSGLLDQLITPQFKKRFPQYNLKFVAVGTGQAITNARAGQGDVLIGHSPA
ncbi:MAG: tungstate transport system substrate-binding protein, partial [Solirubrobacteraceae bacterium]|nr:tungstate transport system substrate-binding protein [Solirubrobacteraceae bacterium]